MAAAIPFRTGWRRKALVAVIALSAVATAVLGVRTLNTFLVLRSAYAAGAPDLSSVRAWMTIRYVATTYRALEPALLERLGLPHGTDPDTTLKSLAERAGLSRVDYVQRVQRVLAEVAPELPRAHAPDASSLLGGTGDEIVSALLVYGYPALGLTLVLAAVGLPLPSGLAMVVAGSLAAQGRMSWPEVGALAVAASVLGDCAGYGIGRALGGELLERRGRWLGFTAERRARVERLFERWGTLAVLLSRSLVSFLSSAVNLVAGAGRYPLGTFVAYAVAGRLLWSAAYLGLGYGASSGLEPAADFLRTLSGLLVALALLGGSAFALLRRPGAGPVAQR